LLSSPGKPDRERRYIQKISELEELAEKLRTQLDAVLAREATLNKAAQTRGAALRYASTAAGKTTAAEVPGTSSAEPSGRTGRADLDGLAEMLDRLFVENFALRGKGSSQRGSAAIESFPSVGCRSFRGSTSGATVAETTSPKLIGPGGSMGPLSATLDLSRFVLDEGNGSDGESSDADVRRAPRKNNNTRQGPMLLPLTSSLGVGAASVKTPSQGTAAAFPSATSTTTVSHSAEALPSPRSRLLMGLDFNNLPVVE